MKAWMAPVSAMTFRAPPMIIRKPTILAAPLMPFGIDIKKSRIFVGFWAMKWNEFGSTIIRPLAASLMRTNSPAGTIYVAMALKTRMTAMIIIGLGTETFLFWTGFAAC